MKLVSDGIYLRAPTAEDEEAFLEGVRDSAELHYPWVEPPSTPAHYRSYMQRIAAGRTFGYLACDAGDHCIVGVVNLNDVVTGRFLSANLGYYAFVPHQGQGRMVVALRLVVDHAFTVLGMHRLEANIQPENEASLRLVRRCGFRREGYSPRFLYLNGAWRDHERWAIVHRRNTLLP